MTGTLLSWVRHEGRLNKRMEDCIRIRDLDMDHKLQQADSVGVAIHQQHSERKGLDDSLKRKHLGGVHFVICLPEA